MSEIILFSSHNETISTSNLIFDFAFGASSTCLISEYLQFVTTNFILE